MKLGLVLCLSRMLIAIPWCASAQVPQADRPNNEKPPIMTVPFFAVDKKGDPIAIDETALSIEDDKVRVPILGIKGAAELPLRLGFLIDTSASETRSNLHDAAAQAASNFLSRVLKRPEDKLFLVTFATTVDGTAFMNKDEFQRFRIDLHGGGGTALFDAVSFASERIQKELANPARHVLVIVSDGGDNLSHLNHEQAIAAAQKAGTVIFTVSTNESANSGLANRALGQLAEQTGGRAFLHLSKKDMPNVFSSILEQIEHMNVVSFCPPHLGKPGQLHSVELSSGGDKKMKLRTPRGYYISE